MTKTMWVLERLLVIQYIFNSYFDTHDFLYKYKIKSIINKIKNKN